MAFLAGGDLGVGPFLQEDATNFFYIGSVPQLIDSSDRGPSIPDKEAENLLCSLRCLLQAPLRPRHHHPPNTRHPDRLELVLQDAPFECVLSWWFSGRSWVGC